jgi:hypothetical protein
MEGEDASSAAEAALGLSPQLFINEVLNTVDEVRCQAFEYCLQLSLRPPPSPYRRLDSPPSLPTASLLTSPLSLSFSRHGAPEAVGAATASQKAQELERVSSIRPHISVQSIN